MSGYRVMAGVGSLPRNLDSASGTLPEDIPDGETPLSCLQNYLTKRLGAGVTMSLSRTRNNNYIQEMGLREFTAATSGNYEVDFSFDGIFSPKLCVPSAPKIGGEAFEGWLAYAFMMGYDNKALSFQITNVQTNLKEYTDGTFTTEASNPQASDVVYIADGPIPAVGAEDTRIKFGQPMLHKDVEAYKTFANVAGKTVNLFGYATLTGPKYFDIGYQKINSHASGVNKYDGLDEIGVLVGCVIDSASISYESGSDAGVKFSISGHALRDIVQMVDGTTFDYASVLDPVPTQVFVGGCVSIFKNTAYEAVAQTDSASISIANNTTKLGNCLKLNYSSYALGALTYDVSTSTYSNDPNKYLKYLYGYSDDLVDGSTYFIAKQPIPIGHMKIRTDDTSATRTQGNETIFMDINMSGVYVGDMSNSYSVDSAIMDEPSLRPQKVYVAVGYSTSQSEINTSYVVTIKNGATLVKKLYLPKTNQAKITDVMLDSLATLDTVSGEVVKTYPTLYRDGTTTVFNYVTSPVTSDLDLNLQAGS